MKKPLLLAAWLVAATIPLPAQYQAPSVASNGTAARSNPAAYFNPSLFDPRGVLPNPPSAESPETTQEIETILQAQADRTQAQVDRITNEDHYNVFVFGNVVPWLNAQSIEKLPRATALLSRAMETAKPIVDTAADVWKRPGPYLANSRVFPAIKKPDEPSYPSSHSTRATLDALILAQLSPGNAMAIKQRAMQVGDDRVIAGVQYPSDVLAGRKMAQAIYDRMMNEKSFRDDLKAAQAEVKDYEQKHP